MKKTILTYLLFVCLLTLVGTSVPAQTGQMGSQISKLRMELERTDQIIERAREAVRVSQSPVARISLEKALQLQNLAWENFRTGTTEGYKAALLLTRQAREQAQNAMSYGRVTEQNTDLVLRRLEKVDDMVDRLKESLQEDSDRNFQGVYDAARNNLDKAWEFYRSGQYRPALKLANQVERALRKIWQAANRNQRQAENVYRQLERVGELVESVRVSVVECSSDPALRSFREAEKSYQTGEDAAAKENYVAAAKALERARRLALEAKKECTSLDDLENRYQRLKGQADGLRERLGNRNSNAQRLLKQAYEQLEKAAGHIGGREVNRAAAALKAAELSLNQLKQLLGGGRK
ncbi:MAG: hypothetical protein OEW00_07385 [candidate division Zixibacteria bacterium]|nr:hypothetical protein [candidate division Zixibacteria bacterium]